MKQKGYECLHWCFVYSIESFILEKALDKLSGLFCSEYRGVF